MRPLPRCRTWLMALLLSCAAPIAVLADDSAPVSVRVSNHEGYGRIVFTPSARTDYVVKEQGQQVIVQFQPDTTFGAVSAVPRNVLAINCDTGRAEITIAPGTTVHAWRFGERVVVDVLDPGTTPGRQRPATKPAASSPIPASSATASSATGSPSQTSARQPRPAKPPPSAPTPPSPQTKPQPPPATPAPAAAAATPPPSTAAAAPTAPEAPNPPAPALAQPAEVPTASVADADANSPPAPVEPGLVVPFETPLGVAAFRRGDFAVIVLDQPCSIDLAPLHDDKVFGTAKVETLPGGTVIRLRLDRGRALSASQTASTWHITSVADAPKLRPIIASAADGRLTLAATAPGKVLSVTDPDTGSTLLVGTQQRDGQGVVVEHRAVEYTLPPTWQGVVIEPIADTLALRTTQDGFVLTGPPGGLVQSPPANIADQLAHSASVTRQFDFPGQPVPALLRRLGTLVDQDAATAPLSRGPRREAVARAMIALGLGAEAQAVLGVAATDDPQEAASPSNAALTSMAALLAKRLDATNGLDDPRLADSDDVAFWRAARLAELQEGSPAAAAVFATTLPLVLAYPSGIRDRLLPLVAETLVTGGQTAAATVLLDALKDDATLDLARAMLKETQNDRAGALAIYDRLANSDDRLLHARAATRAVELRLAIGAINASEAADRLDQLLYAWRGDTRELSLRERLAQLRANTGGWRSALNLLRESEALFPDDKAAIHTELTEMFANLLRGNTADGLPALELVALADENTDLLPTGPEAEALEARLADRLLALDLPKRAGPVLEKLMQAAPTPAGRAGFGSRLAALRLREGDAGGALAALSASGAPDLPAELAERRTLLFADASARHGDTDHAMAALASLDTPAADEAKATILERASNWPGAEQALQAYAAKTVPEQAVLDDGQRRVLLRLATAAARAGDDATLATLRQQDGPRMGSGPLADLFHLLTADAVHSVADLNRSAQETTLAHGLPDQLKALQPPTRPMP
jgi:hypothetical protein